MTTLDNTNIKITKFWLNKNYNQTIIVQQTLDHIRMIVNQNYFQHNDRYFKPTKA